MRVLQVILGMVALLLISVQTFRHAYILWIEPRGSVLDKYNKTEQKIDSAASLEDLVALYEKAREEEEKAEKDRIEQAPKGTDVTPKVDPKDLPVAIANGGYVVARREAPTYLLKSAIETWEAHEKQLHQLHFYWWTGFASMILGLLGYYFINRWLGMTGIIAGVSEMIWWTSPVLRAGGSHVEFDRLLLLKFIYSCVTYVLVFGAWCIFSGRFAKRKGTETETAAPVPTTQVAS